VRLRVQRMATALSDLATALLRRSRKEGLSHPILDSFVAALERRSALSAASFET
jgi:hypothetical protein